MYVWIYKRRNNSIVCSKAKQSSHNAFKYAPLTRGWQKHKEARDNFFYNRTKFGVDLLDLWSSNYSTALQTCRWPFDIFYRLLDVSTSNAYVVRLSPQPQKRETRFHFIKKLAEQLTRPYMERREKNIHLQRDIKIAFCRILQIHETDTPAVAGCSCDE